MKYYQNMRAKVNWSSNSLVIKFLEAKYKPLLNLSVL